MAVKINSKVVQRFEPVGPSSVGRIDTTLPDATVGGRRQAAALEDVGSDAVKFIERQENQAIDDTTSQLTNDYEKEYRTGLLGLKQLDGDPTERYMKFEEDMEKRRAEIYEDPNLTDKAKRILDGKMNKRGASLEMQNLVQFGSQQVKYQEANFKSGNILTERRALDALGMPSEENDFSLFQAELDVMVNDHKKHGIKRGTIAQDDEGRIVSVGKSAQLRMGEDVSKTITGGINSLLAKGDVERAEQMRERYKDQIVNVSKMKIDKNLKDTKDQQSVFADAQDIQGLAPDKRQAALNKLGIEQRVEVGKVLDDIARSEQTRDKINSTKSYNELFDLSHDENGNPIITSLSQLEANESYRQLIGNMNPGDVKALRNSIEQPKTSSTKVYTKALDTLSEGGLRGLSASDFTQLVSGLNKSDTTFFRGQWVKDNDQSVSQERASANSMVASIRRQAIGMRLVKKRRGFLTAKDDAYINGLQTRLLLEFDKLPKNMSIKEQNDVVKNFLADEAVTRGKSVETLAPIRSLNANVKSFRDLTSAQQVELRDDFLKTKGRRAGNFNELNDFLNER